MAFFKNREGLQLHYEEQGEGDVLLFLPGWGAPCIMYRPYMEALSGRINWFAYTNVPLLIVGALFTSLAFMPISMLTGLLIIDCAEYNEYTGGPRMEGTMSVIPGLGTKPVSAHMLTPVSLP